VSLPFCATCKYIYERDIEELKEEAMAWVKTQDGPKPALYGCAHAIARQLSNAFVSCERMRLNGAPCTPEGNLYEHDEERAEAFEHRQDGVFTSNAWKLRA
jgi:hypothetical protein